MARSVLLVAGSAEDARAVAAVVEVGGSVSIGGDLWRIESADDQRLFLALPSGAVSRDYLQTRGRQQAELCLRAWDPVEDRLRDPDPDRADAVPDDLKQTETDEDRFAEAVANARGKKFAELERHLAETWTWPMQRIEVSASCPVSVTLPSGTWHLRYYTSGPPEPRDVSAISSEGRWDGCYEGSAPDDAVGLFSAGDHVYFRRTWPQHAIVANLFGQPLNVSSFALVGSFGSDEKSFLAQTTADGSYSLVVSEQLTKGYLCLRKFCIEGNRLFALGGGIYYSQLNTYDILPIGQGELSMTRQDVFPLDVTLHLMCMSTPDQACFIVGMPSRCTRLVRAAFSLRAPPKVASVEIPISGFRAVVMAWRPPHVVMLSDDRRVLLVDSNLQSFRLGTLPYADALLLDACFVGDRVLLLLKASSGPRYVMQQDPSMDLRFLAISPTPIAE